jgi:hypothetical protein
VTVFEVSIGTVFKILGSDDLWIRATEKQLRKLPQPGFKIGAGWQTYSRDHVGRKQVEVVRLPETSAIRRAGDVLYLSEGDVQLEHLYPWLVRSATIEKKLTRFVLNGPTFEKSVVDAASEETALPFTIVRGSKHLGRPPSTMIFAYKGRVYARATAEEVTGRKTSGGYKRVLVLDGAKRLLIAGLLTLPEEGALYDVIQDHFGPGVEYP